MRKLGFTLAEVLITLGIIGVIASLTLKLRRGNNNIKNDGSLCTTIFFKLILYKKLLSIEQVTTSI